MKNTRNYWNIYFLAIFCFYVWMAAQIPYTHDDWDWGLPIGLEQFLHATVNSRYAGNFFEVVMTRSEFLKVVIMGTTYFLIPFLLMQIVTEEQGIMESNRKLLLFLFCNCMLLTMNHIMWRQVYGWVAGFANFAISAVFLVLWLKELCKAFVHYVEGENDSPGKVALHFVISFFGQLFIENIAIYCVMLACVLCGIYYFNYRQIPYRILAMGGGAVNGLIVMFSSSLYKTLFTTGYAVGGYRTIPMIGFDSFVDAVSAFKGQVLNLVVRLYSNNIALSIVVLVLLLYVLYYKKEKINIGFYTASAIANCVLLITFVVLYLYDTQYDVHSTIVSYIQFFLSITYFLVIAVEVFFCFRKEKRGKLLALWISPPVLIAPLLVTEEYGFRLFFTSNVFVILFALMLFAELLKEFSHLAQKRIGCILICATVLLFAFYGRIYKGIGECKRSHESIIQEAVRSDNHVIILPAYPHDKYLHNPYPKGSSRNIFFKSFYGIPDDTELKFE